MAEKTINKAPSGRPKRLPVGHRNRLQVVDKDPEYVYRWVNASADGGDRPAILAESGYEYVPKSSVRTSNNIRTSTGGPLGAYETTPGGGGDTLVLMRQKREYYEEDQAAKQERVDMTDRAQHKTPDGLYGSITTKKE